VPTEQPRTAAVSFVVGVVLDRPRTIGNVGHDVLEDRTSTQVLGVPTITGQQVSRYAVRRSAGDRADTNAAKASSPRSVIRPLLLHTRYRCPERGKG